jgi:ABC-type antimicrobial peptide transport system permease subunit
MSIRISSGFVYFGDIEEVRFDVAVALDDISSVYRSLVDKEKDEYRVAITLKSKSTDSIRWGPYSQEVTNRIIREFFEALSIYKEDIKRFQQCSDEARIADIVVGD